MEEVSGQKLEGKRPHKEHIRKYSTLHNIIFQHPVAHHLLLKSSILRATRPSKTYSEVYLHHITCFDQHCLLSSVKNC